MIYKNKTKNSSFTLIELLLSISILAVAGIGAYRVLSSGISFLKWQKNFRLHGDVDIFFEKFAYDIRNSCSINNINFSGDKTKAIFAFHDPSVNFLTTKDDFDLKKDIDLLLYKVEYIFVADKKELRRRVYSLKSGKLLKDSRILSGGDNCTFSYFRLDNFTGKISKISFLNGFFPMGVEITVNLMENNKTVTLIDIIDVPQIS